MNYRACAAALTAAAVMAAGDARAQAAQGLELGLQSYGYTYEETFEGGGIEDEGRMTGFTVEYGRPVGRFSFDARFRYAQGEIDYKAGDGARLNDVPQASGQLELLLGRPFPLSAGTTVTPYVGLGSRVLLDDSGGRVTATGLEGYDREVSYAYVPLGAATRSDLGGGRTLALNGQVDWLVGGEVSSDFRRLGDGAPLVKTEFNEGYGLELSATYFTPVRGARIGFGPFLRYWDVDQSDSVVLTDEDGSIELFEPPNTTWEVGLKLVVGF